MDPLTIATTAGTAIAAIYKTCDKCRTFAKDARVIDEVLQALRSDLSSLVIVLETVRSTLRKPPQLIISSMEGSGASTFLTIVHAAIQECHDTADSLEHRLKTIEDGSTSKSLVARSIRQVRFIKMKDDFKKTQARLKAQKGSLQLLLQTLNVSIAQYPTSMLKETITPRLSNLESMLRRNLLLSLERRDRRVQGTLLMGVGSEEHTHAEIRASEMPESADSPSASYLESAESTASASSEGTGRAWGSQEGESRGNLEQDSTEPTLISDESVWDDIASSQLKESDPDSDEDREIEHSLTALATGRDYYERRHYRQAESLLRNALQIAAGTRTKTVGVKNIKWIQYRLADTYMYLEKWDDAMEILHYLTAEPLVWDLDSESDQDAPSEIECCIHARFTLARVYAAKREFDAAITVCKEARTGYKRLFGKKSDLYVKATQLLILLYVLNGDDTAIRAYGEGIELESYSRKGLTSLLADFISSERDNRYDGLYPDNRPASRIKRVPSDWLLERGLALNYVVEKGWMEHVKILCCVGVNVNFRDEDGQTPLELANGKVREFLKNMGATWT